MANPDRNDQQFCWQQVLRVQPGFRLSHAYAPEKYAAGLLALYALFSALEEALSNVSDEQVALAKLTWWQQQLLSPEYQTSEHPITRQLNRSGVIRSEAKNQFRGLLATAIERLGATAPKDERALASLCQSVGLQPTLLEVEMQGGHDDISTPMKQACAVNGLVQLLRESSRNQLQPYAWIPLYLVARYDLRRDELPSRAETEKIRGLMDDVCQLGLSWVGNGDLCSQLQEGAEWKRRHRHWIIHTQINIGRLKNLRRLGLPAHAREFRTVRASSAWLAWRTARKIHRGGSAG